MINGLNNQEKPVLEIKNISKSFPGVQALSGVDFSLYPGEVHIIAGENGAGKSTLIKCLLGIESFDQGEICFKGEQVSFESPRQAIARGLAAVHQELTMIPYLDAVQNIFFQKELVYKGTNIMQRKKMEEEAIKLLKLLHSEHIPLHVPVRQLGIASQQMIEVAKAMASDPEVLIFDEPTSALSEREVDFLFQQIQALKKQGIAIIYISHRMSEYDRIGDRVTVLRDGKMITSQLLADLSQEELIRHMVGRSFTSQRKHNKVEAQENRKELLLRTESLSDRSGKVKDCSLEVHRGEIVGIAGLLGSGRTELMNLIYGIDKPAKGKVYFCNQDVTGFTPGKMVEQGVGFLTEDRKNTGLAQNTNISRNIVAASLKKLFPHGILSDRKNDAIAGQYVKELDIATPSVHKIVSELSGGNQQKVAIGKWLSAREDLLIFDEPTKGVDIGAKIEIYALIEKLAAQGKSILLISSEMEEVLSLSDRIYVMNEGRISKELAQSEFNMEALGKAILSENKDRKFDTDKKKLSLSLSPAFFMILIMFLIFGLKADHYFSWGNFTNILNQAAPLLVIACGQTLIILIQGTDLSIGAMAGFITVLWVYCLNMGISLPLSVLLCILSGIILGICNSLLVSRVMIPMFIVTLGTQNIMKSAGLLLCQNQTLYSDHPFFHFMSSGNIAGISYSVWIAFLCFVLTYLLLKYTTFGMRIKGLGGNPEALRYAGSNINRTMLKIFAYVGLMAAIGGMLLCIRIESGNQLSGNGMEFNSIAAVLLGGTSMRQGRGGVGGTIFGVLMIQILKSGLMQIGVSSVYQNAMIGAVVLGAIIVDAAIKKREDGKV